MSLTEFTESKRWFYFSARLRRKIKPIFSFCFPSVFSVSSSELGERVRVTSNSGIALIMVLGLLAVMVILAVTFAISMRTERLAAGNYADTVRARELVQVGLARALNDLAGNLGPTGLYSKIGVVPVGKAYPDWNVTNSYTNTDGSGSARWNTNIYLIQRSATNYVPRALWTDAANADYLSPSNHWLPVESVAPPAPGLPDETNLMGRVAYLIINCSGLLDANYAGGATRIYGTNPNEIAIANLDEIVGAENSFITSRTANVRYETLAQLNAMGGFNYPATNLFVYSRALPGYWNTNLNCVGTQVNLSGSAAQLLISERVTAITNAFTNLGFNAYASGVLFSNLIDYVDDDLIPSNFEYCVENVPMINEVVVSNAIVVSAGSVAANRTYKVITDVYVETWYPFVKSVVVSFNLNVTNKFSGTAGFQHSDYTDNTAYPAASAPLKYLCGHFEKDIPDQLAVNPITLTTKIDPRIQLGVFFETADKLKTPIELTTTHDGSTIARDNKAASFECLDPRFNNDPANSSQWRLRAISPSDAQIADVNPWVAEWWSTNLAGDVDSGMHVADDQLRSVAELGYLVYSPFEPWKTVKLYGSGRHRVLDVFGLSTNTSDVFMTNIVYHGLVNCNSNSALDATAVVFAGMPVDQYPGGTHTDLTMDEARTVASTIFSGGIFTNLSDIGRSLTNFPSSADTELKKEAFFRNACGLLNLRQNMFTIIIEAQVAYSGGNIPMNPARQRAVAIVWRDPYTGEMFVRHIKWLGD